MQGCSVIVVEQPDFNITSLLYLQEIIMKMNIYIKRLNTSILVYIINLVAKVDL